MWVVSKRFDTDWGNEDFDVRFSDQASAEQHLIDYANELLLPFYAPQTAEYLRWKGQLESTPTINTALAFFDWYDGIDVQIRKEEEN